MEESDVKEGGKGTRESKKKKGSKERGGRVEGRLKPSAAPVDQGAI
jgi:hypothetical protein